MVHICFLFFYRPPTSSRRPVSYVRVPVSVYKDHEIIEEPEDYEGEYDMRGEEPHHDYDDEEHREPPVKAHKIRKQKYNTKYKGEHVELEDLEPQIITGTKKDPNLDNGYRTIVPRPILKPSRPPYHPIYEEQPDVAHYWDTDTAYTSIPSSTQSSRSIPPYVITSTNYGGRYNYNSNNYPYMHQYTPPTNHNRPNNQDADIGYGQGMEVVDDRPNRSPHWG